MIAPRTAHALLLALALLTACADPPPSAALVHHGPLPVASFADEPPTGDDGESRMNRGLRAYGEGRWTAAIAELEAARLKLGGFKEVMVQLFLGSALRLGGRYERALVPLDLVVAEARRAQSTELLDMAQFERCQALLALGRVVEARTGLREVVAVQELHAEQATEQLRRIEELPATP